VCSFSALTLLVGSFDPYKPVPDMTYNVFGGTLSLTQSINRIGYKSQVNLCLWVVSPRVMVVKYPPLKLAPYSGIELL